MLSPVHKDRHRHQGQGRRVEHQKQNLRVTGRGLAGVQLLQRTHGLEANRCGGVVQTQTIGREVEGNQPQRRMTRRDVRHQVTKQRTQDFGQPINDPGLLGNAQKPEPEGEGAEQQDHHIDRQLGHGEDAFHHRCKDPGIPANQPLRQRRDRRHHKKAKP